MKRFIIKPHKLFSLSVLLFLLLINISTTVFAYDYSFPNKKPALFQNTSSVDLSVELAFCDDSPPTGFSGHTCILVSVTNNGSIKATGVNLIGTITNFTSIKDMALIKPNETPEIFNRYANPHDVPKNETEASFPIMWIIDELEVNQTTSMKIFVDFSPINLPLLQKNGYHLLIEVSVSSNENEIDQTNNSAIIGDAFLILNIDKSVTPLIPLIGEEAIFTISVTNGSNVTATNLVIEDHLPDGYSINLDDPTSIITSQGTYQTDTGLWKIDRITPNAAETLSIKVSIEAPLESAIDVHDLYYLNSSEILSAEQSINHYFSTTKAFSSIYLYDLEVSMNASRTTFQADDTVFFTTTVTNHGINTAKNVKINISMKDGFTIIENDADQFFINQAAYSAGTDLIWDIGDMAAGERITVNFTATINTPSNIYSFNNSASVSAEHQYEYNNENNETTIEFHYLNSTPTPTEISPDPTATPTPSGETEIPLVKWGNYGGTGYLLFNLSLDSYPQPPSGNDEDENSPKIFSAALLAKDPQPCEVIQSQDPLPTYLAQILTSLNSPQSRYVFCDLPYYLNARSWNGSLLLNGQPLNEINFEITTWIPTAIPEQNKPAPTKTPCLGPGAGSCP